VSSLVAEDVSHSFFFYQEVADQSLAATPPRQIYSDVLHTLTSTIILIVANHHIWRLGLWERK
jgi:hypothetical protein